MPYFKSAARKQFETSSKKLKSQCKKSSYKIYGLPNDIQQCVYRNAIFQTSASLEEYVKNAFLDWIFALKSSPSTINKLPPELIMWEFGQRKIDVFKNFIVTGDSLRFIDNLSSDNKCPSYFLNETKVDSLLSGNNFVTDRKYPSEKNLIHLFHLVGIKNVFTTIHSKWHKNCKNTLSSFSDVRTEIAHQNPANNLVVGDVVLHLENLEEFVSYLDKLLFSVIVNVSGLNYWKKDSPLPV